MDWIQVAWFEAAQAQQVEPGKTCWMRDTSEPYIYAKAVDMMGTPLEELSVVTLEKLAKMVIPLAIRNQNCYTTINLCIIYTPSPKLYNQKCKKKYPKKLNLLLTINQKCNTMGLPKRLKEVVMW